ncbi:MAG: hypothetical protein IH589_01295 [Anaerolineales bacterium]|nr:hypothetical protein [Anaerolineales bacterium]
MQIPFDGILTLLVFLVGIPALILQLISVAERRAVIKKQGLDVQSFLKKAITVILIGLFFQFLFMFLLEKQKDVIRNFVEQFIWLWIFCALFYLVIKVSKQIPEQYGRREKIVEKLTQDILNESKRKGRIAGGTFNDLANLGQQCDPGQEREMVINAFKDLVKIMLVQSTYKGDSFEALIDELVHMLVANPEPRDLPNFNTAIKILSAVLSVDDHLETDDDKQRALHAISKLGRTLIVHFKSVERDNIILDYIDSVEFVLAKKAMLTEVSQALFEIGICAVEEGQDFMVVAALDKMTSLAEKYPPLPNEFVTDMLGLLAHFWAKGGSRKKFAEAKLGEVEKFLPRSHLLSLEGAKTHCEQTMYFDVADELANMIETLRPRRKPHKKK